MTSFHRTRQLLLPLVLTLSAVLNGASAWAACGTDSDAVREVEFTATYDGSQQFYCELLPEDFKASKPHDVLIALHGHGGDRREYMIDQLPESRATREVARKHEMIFVTPDYRAPTSWMGPAAEADLVQIIAQLRQNHWVGRIFLMGQSMGGSSALTFGVLHPDLLSGICSQNGTANYLEFNGFQPTISSSFGGTKQEIPLEYKKRSAEYWPEILTMPIAFTVSGLDDVVPPQSVLRLAGVLTNLNRPIKLIYRPEMQHQSSYEDTVDALEFMISTALDSRVPATTEAAVER